MNSFTMNSFGLTITAAVLLACVSSLPIDLERAKRGTKIDTAVGAGAGAIVAGVPGALAGGTIGALAGHAHHQTTHPDSSHRTKRGTGTGVVLGAIGGGLVGGPVGALAGATIGGVTGHELDKANQPKEVIVVPESNAGTAPEVVGNRTKREGLGKKAGGAAGAFAGYKAAGLPGALVGLGLGAYAGHELHKHTHPKASASVPVATA